LGLKPLFWVLLIRSVAKVADFYAILFHYGSVFALIWVLKSHFDGAKVVVCGNLAFKSAFWINNPDPIFAFWPDFVIL
jgi:hypothetical protein